MEKIKFIKENIILKYMMSWPKYEILCTKPLNIQKYGTA